MCGNENLEQDFLTDLPPELIVIEILSRLTHIKCLYRCKCVCKPLLNLIESPDEMNMKSPFSTDRCLVVHHEGQRSYKVFEFVDESSPTTFHGCNMVFDCSFPRDELCIHSSAKGLLLLSDTRSLPACDHLVFNPVTCEYIQLPQPPNSLYCRDHHIMPVSRFGFGVSQMSEEYKVVRIVYFIDLNKEEWAHWRFCKSECQVYTLGTGAWRSINASESSVGSLFLYEWTNLGTSLNGNCHWLVFDVEGSPSISCFDLEAELFSTFPLPHLDGVDGVHYSYKTLSTMGGCLCLCEMTSEDKMVIWLMKEYGDAQSWTKEFVVTDLPPTHLDGIATHFPYKVFKESDILIANEGMLIKRNGQSRLLCYCNKTNTLEETDLTQESEVFDRTSAVSYTPTTFSLKTFTEEKVRSF